MGFVKKAEFLQGSGSLCAGVGQNKGAGTGSSSTSFFQKNGFTSKSGLSCNPRRKRRILKCVAKKSTFRVLVTVTSSNAGLFLSLGRPSRNSSFQVISVARDPVSSHTVSTPRQFSACAWAFDLGH